MDTTNKRIVEFIEKHPFCTKKQIANYFDISVSGVNYHLDKIKKTYPNFERGFKKLRYKPVDTYRFLGQRVPKSKQV